MATRPLPPGFNSSSASLGLVTPETMARFPAATYLLGRQAATEAGLDVSDPVNVARAVQSRTGADRVARATAAQSKNDKRVIDRVLGASAPVFHLPMGEGGVDANLMEGARESSMAITRTSTGRSAVGREVMRENDKLTELAQMDTAIDARERKLKDKGLQGIERNILDVKSKALAARAILRSTLGNMSPSQRNAVLAAQGNFFTGQLQNLEALRAAREGAIDTRVAEDRDALQAQVSAAQQRVEGLKTTLDIMEANGADASAMADIRVKLSQEREKLRKKSGGAGGVSSQDVVLDALVRQSKSRLGRELSSSEMTELKRQATLISRNKSFDTLMKAGDSPITAPGGVGGTPGLQLMGGRNVAVPGQDVGPALEMAGFGIIPSREELAKNAENEITLKALRGQ